MDFKEFAEQAKRTMNDEGKEMNLYHSAIGIFTEVGELSDQFKKHIFYKKELDIVNINEEVGDVLWYVSIIARELGLVDDIKKWLVNLDQVNDNKEKLNTLLDLQRLSGKISEELKDIIIDGKKFNKNLNYILYIFIEKLSFFKNISFSEIMDLNIAKLKEGK